MKNMLLCLILLPMGNGMLKAQNVGIGTTTPNAPLQFPSDTRNRKIVLFEFSNNDHQYYGFGVNGGLLRYQTATEDDDHVFFSGQSSTTSSELMRIRGNGNVGIGTNNPSKKLSVRGAVNIDDGDANTGTVANALTFGNNSGEGIGSKRDVGNNQYGLDFYTGSDIRLSITNIGNVGIGVNSPNAPLHFNNALQNRKIVLYETQNDNHQYYGFGVNGGLLRYQTATAGDDHVFFSGQSATSSSELMRIRGNGNVGIGTINPSKKLALQNRKIVLYETQNNEHQFHGFGINNSVFRYQVPVTGDAHVFYAGTSATTSNELFRIQGNGNVGIGQSNPNAPLHFNNALQNRKIVLYETQNNEHQFHGFGINNSVFRYQIPVTGDAHVFYAGTSATTSNELFRIQGNGGIGVNGNTGTPGDILVSGGTGAASWAGISSAIPIIIRKRSIIPSETEEVVNSLTINFSTTRNTQVLIWIDITLQYLASCFVGPCPVSGRLVSRMNGGSPVDHPYITAFYPGSESSETRCLAVVEYTVAPGTHQYTISSKRTSGAGFLPYVEAKMMLFAK